jgi:hypothetical protein
VQLGKLIVQNLRNGGNNLLGTNNNDKNNYQNEQSDLGEGMSLLSKHVVSAVKETFGSDQSNQTKNESADKPEQ